VALKTAMNLDGMYEQFLTGISPTFFLHGLRSFTVYSKKILTGKQEIWLHGQRNPDFMTDNLTLF
jgi:hypothetical protein